MKALKTFLKQTSTTVVVILTIITTVFSGVYAIWGFMDKKEARDKERQQQHQAELKEWVVAALYDIVLTKKEFYEYQRAQANKDSLQMQILRDMALATDSTLVVVLPPIAESQRRIDNRLSLLENLVANKDTGKSDSEKVWEYLRNKEKTDSTARRHAETMLYLKRILRERMKARYGDRAE